MNHKLNKPHMEDVFYFLNYIVSVLILKKKISVYIELKTGPNTFIVGQAREVD